LRSFTVRETLAWRNYLTQPRFLPCNSADRAAIINLAERQYTYYRCTQYHRGDHPRTRLTEGELDGQMLAIFDMLRVEDDEFRHTFREELRKATNWDERSSAVKAKQFQDDLVRVRDQQNREHTCQS
jgi:site-specific DNA recombinase